MKTMTPWVLGLLSTALVACAGEATQTKTTSAELPVPNADGNYRPGWPVLGNGPERFITIHLGPDEFAQCRMVSPKFPFNSASTYVEDDDQLAALVRCLNHPSMESRGVLLVGRADPRGTDAYNLKLGQERAEHIREFLVKQGLAPTRIATDSEGKRDAKGGTPDYSYGYDRRVDVVVVGGTHSP
jgi:OOP family OmpA-OmpF porin